MCSGCLSNMRHKMGRTGRIYPRKEQRTPPLFACLDLFKRSSQQWPNTASPTNMLHLPSSVSSYSIPGISAVYFFAATLPSLDAQQHPRFCAWPGHTTAGHATGQCKSSSTPSLTTESSPKQVIPFDSRTQLTSWIWRKQGLRQMHLIPM